MRAPACDHHGMIPSSSTAACVYHVLVNKGVEVAVVLGLLAFVDETLPRCMQDTFTNGIAGIAYVGADICGFMGIASGELCARWAAAGAWQPFARNHHADGFQEFYL